jgi:predicted aspartyl protease
MGKVLAAAKVENLSDLFGAEQGSPPPEQVRRVEVDDALVDAGASMLGVPKRLIAQLGLKPYRTRKAQTAGGPVSLPVYSAVRLTVQGRDCTCDVLELPDECPVLIGRIPLEQLDFVVDPVGQRLIGNPAHGGEHVAEMY